MISVISACTVAASLDHRSQHMDGPPAETESTSGRKRGSGHLSLGHRTRPLLGAGRSPRRAPPWEPRSAFGLGPEKKRNLRWSFVLGRSKSRVVKCVHLDPVHLEFGRLFESSILTTSNKKLLGAPGLTTRSKDAARGSWHHY